MIVYINDTELNFKENVVIFIAFYWEVRKHVLKDYQVPIIGWQVKNLKCYLGIGGSHYPTLITLTSKNPKAYKLHSIN